MIFPSGAASAAPFSFGEPASPNALPRLGPPPIFSRATARGSACWRGAVFETRNSGGFERVGSDLGVDVEIGAYARRVIKRGVTARNARLTFHQC